ncbi:hypothetical protein PPYR_09286 [Photinus pyralis]|uniref:Uncharacterized protein n=2 Tax=Photinus pyralis TaxID=7054 RepID=A0A1Y1KHA2_PHOPY|nr:hypothetical protein PPYR_09286 [Photinus pyralis]
MDHVAVCVLMATLAHVTNQHYTSTTDGYTVIDMEVPSKPLNITVLGVTSTSVYLSWSEPLRANGPIDGYRIYFMHANLTGVQTHRIHGGGSNIQYNLTQLKPNTEYDIWVKAFTAKNEGERSDSIINKTDISGPSPPIILNLTCQAQDTIFLHWQRPLESPSTIDFYHIYIYTIGALVYDNITLPTSKEHLQTSYSIKNLTTDMLYHVQISAASYSHYTDKLIEGQLSEPKEVLVQSNCDKIQQYMRHTTNELSAGMIAGVGCAAFAFLLSILAFFIWRKCFHSTYYYLDDLPCSVPSTSLDWNVASDPSGDYKGAIPVDMFGKHVAELHADGDIGFSKEYEAIQSNHDEYSSEHSQHTDNRAKNRYLNIIAYDHSRVQLLQMPGQKKNIDYINANYIDGFQWSKAYIGTQGPLPSTFDCFWRMVWEQRVTIIVMITNLVERGRRKCDMYWPKEGTETYGVIQVKLVKEDIMATYTVRTLQIRHLRIKKKKAAMAEKLVYQYHYTNWPDHGTPDHPLPVLHFVKKSASANPPDGGPIIVHCSAGVGRTGTYIVLDAMLKQIRSRSEVNIFGFLRHIRSQRNFLVQTEEQYIFIHDALLEAIESGETNIKKEQIPKYVQILQSSNVEEKTEPWKPLEYQFKLVTSFQCKDFNVISANKVINKPKNRSEIVSVESSRVHLTPKPGEDGSDYINATWIQGYNSLREFIITQHPMKETIKDFWQMVWDHNAQTIVMLSIIDEEFEMFWPTEQESIDSDNYKIKLSSEQTEATYVTRDFVMQSLQDDYELHVRMVHWTNWPRQCVYISEIFQLPNAVQETQLGYQNGPVVVVDRFGSSDAATYCCLTTLKKQLTYENHADIYMYSKLYHNKRPGLWVSCDNYLRLHLALQALCTKSEDTPDLYAMANGAINGSLSNEYHSVPPEETPLITHGCGKV